MATNDKDTIYVDIDDEITGIIDKLDASKGKVVALVLPKRAAVFQSIVNMKLLKRAADRSKKNAVLITAEAGLLPLAGAAGVHVAKTLNSKPEIPVGPKEIDDSEEAIQEDGEAIDVPPDTSQTVGQLADTKPDANGVETVTLDDDEPAAAADTAKPGPKASTSPKGAKNGKKNKKLSIPNFNRFRLFLIIGGAALVLLIGILIFVTLALPKATISIKTDATNLDTNLSLDLSTTAKTLEPDNNTIPAHPAQQQKTYTQQVPTTGQKNNGNKASGSVSVINCSDDPVTIPAGTGFSSGGNTYISQQTAVIPNSDFNSKNECKKNHSGTVNILAQNPGSAYNGANNFTVAGQGNLSASASGSISGGTDNIVQSVNQNDINNAKSKIAATGDAEMKKTLSSQLKKDKYYAITATYVAGTPAITTSADVGEVANNVTVTETVTYSMFGVKEKDLKTLIENSIKDQIDTTKQSILDDGLGKAVFNVDSISANRAQLTLSTTATAGPDLDIDTIKKEAAGNRAGAIKSDLGNNPDVTGVDVKISPFWVSTVPNKTDRIKVEIAKPSSSSKAGNSSDDNP